MKPAWGLLRAGAPCVRPALAPWVTRDWAWGGSTGRGVRVAVVDSGVDAAHPWVGGVAGAVAFEAGPGEADEVVVEEGPHEDLYGHGTACAGIVRRLAPDVELYSVRVLGGRLTGRAHVFVAALRWALDNGMHVVNLSLGTRRREWVAALHELADEAFFRSVALVCAADNRPVPSYPAHFASVLSVAAHEGRDPASFLCHPTPPVEFVAPGISLEVAWAGGATMQTTGNSFAAPHISGLAALILAKHPGLTPYELKAVLRATADNAAGR